MKLILCFALVIILKVESRLITKKSVGIVGDDHSNNNDPNFLLNSFTGDYDGSMKKRQSVDNASLLRLLALKKRANDGSDNTDVSWDSASNWNLLKKRFFSTSDLMNDNRKQESMELIQKRADTVSTLITTILRNLVRGEGPKRASDDEVLKRAEYLPSLRPSNTVSFGSH